jgi:hypothetical protein
MLADGLRRRAGDRELRQVPVDDLAALVDLRRRALEDGGGGEALVADLLRLVEIARPRLHVAGGSEVSEQRGQHGAAFEQRAGAV